MTASPTAALAHLRSLAAGGELDAVCDQFGVDLLVAFGSATRASPSTPPADLDLAVRFAPTARRDVVGLAVAVQDLLGLEPVDVMDLERASIVARHRALVGTVPLYERTRGLFAENQIAAILGYMDTAALRRADLALMASTK